MGDLLIPAVLAVILLGFPFLVQYRMDIVCTLFRGQANKVANLVKRFSPVMRFFGISMVAVFFAVGNL